MQISVVFVLILIYSRTDNHNNNTILIIKRDHNDIVYELYHKIIT